MNRCLPLVALLFHLVVIFSDDATDALGQQKLAEVLEDSKAQNGIIKIRGSDFEKYLTKGPRPYFSVIVLTARQSGNCQPCEAIAPEIEKLGLKLEEMRASGKDPNKDKKPVFMFEADFLDNRNVFSKLSLATAPMIIMIPPAKTRRELTLSKLFSKIGNANQYSLATGKEAENIAQWISKQAQEYTIDFGPTFEKLPDWVIMYGVLGIIGVGTLWYLGFVDKIRRSMVLYSIISMLAYGFFIGGGWFSIIRETPWAHSDKGVTSYISHMSQYQFTIEGYIIGAANLVAGIGAFMYICGQRDGWEKNAKGKIVTRWWSRYLPVWVPFSMLVVGWYAVMWAYTRKNGHYNFGRVGMRG